VKIGLPTRPLRDEREACESSTDARSRLRLRKSATAEDGVPGGREPRVSVQRRDAAQLRESLELVWHPAKVATGISDEQYGAFHRLRKTLGSVIHESGQKSGRQLSDWLGHADIAFTQRVYVGQMDSGLGDAEFLDELIPVEGWATDGLHPTRREAQDGTGKLGTNPHQ
jgi:integrase